jgi:TrpR family trp operon transcriptional repressor
MSRNKGNMPGLIEISSVLCEICDPEEMTEFLKEILTPAECKDLSLRWRLMQMLSEGTTQRKIAAELGISLCKITRGAKILKKEKSLSKLYLKLGEHDESKNPS